MNNDHVKTHALAVFMEHGIPVTYMEILEYTSEKGEVYVRGQLVRDVYEEIEDNNFMVVISPGGGVDMYVFKGGENSWEGWTNMRTNKSIVREGR